jgi:hypothetical protein
MELIAEAGVSERPLKRVDAIRDEQRRSLVPLGEKVPHRPIEGPGHPNRETLDGDQRERSIDRPDRRWIAAEDPAASFVQVDVVQVVQLRIEQVDDAID